MTRRLLGLAGPAGSGKSTAAGMTGWVNRAFADPIRKAALAINPIVGQFEVCMDVLGQSVGLGELGVKPVLLRLDDVVRRMGWDAAKTKLAEVRGLLQHIGTEGGRAIHGEDCWVKLADFGHPPTGFKPGEGIVFTDVRERVEIDAIHKHGGMVAWVDGGPGPCNEHPSEKNIGATDCDYWLMNRGTVDELRVKVRRMMTQLFRVAPHGWLDSPDGWVPDPAYVAAMNPV